MRPQRATYVCAVSLVNITMPGPPDRIFRTHLVSRLLELPPHPPVHHPLTIMDAFFTIAPAVPVSVEEPVENIPVDSDGYGTGGNHGSCTIA
ncbi:hypothetical protein BV20DRAFT_1120999 [Pilatotrama ljubarskyi]|nr:hypothetical protein BV20DRAFT_1120999 [Pilatotrama ljubarskyi]